MRFPRTIGALCGLAVVGIPIVAGIALSKTEISLEMMLALCVGFVLVLAFLFDLLDHK